MANATLQGMAQRFPVGTSVAVYKEANWAPHQRPPAGAPVGSPDDTRTVAADGSLGFLSLAPGTRYFAYAQVSSEHRYVGFASKAPSETELARAELSSDFSTTATADTDVTGLVVTFTSDGEPVDVELACQMQEQTANVVATATVKEGAVSQGITAAMIGHATLGAFDDQPKVVSKRIAYPPGVHTLKVTLRNSAAGTTLLRAGAYLAVSKAPV